MSEKLISANYILNLLKDNEPMNWNDTDEEIQEVADWCYFKKLIENAPAVDAVEVVRCRQCCFGLKKREGGKVVTYCGLFWGMKGVLDPNDFCSYGKDINDAKID